MRPQTVTDVRIKVQSGAGQVSANRAYITVGANRFAFLVPGGFKVDTSDPQKVTTKFSTKFPTKVSKGDLEQGLLRENAAPAPQYSQKLQLARELLFLGQAC